MSPSSSLIDLREGVARLLAYTVSDLFPTALCVGGGHTDIGFYYDFLFSQPFLDQTVPLIEVKMRGLLKEEIEVRSLTMMRENAANFFIHHEQPLLAEVAANYPYNLVPMLQINDFYDVCPEIAYKTTTELGIARLIGHEVYVDQEERRITRLQGTAFFHLEDLKQFLKAYDRFPRKDHRLLGPQMGLFEFSERDQCVWYPKGELLRQSILKYWEEACRAKGVLFVKTPSFLPEIRDDTFIFDFIDQPEKQHQRLFETLWNQKKITHFPVYLGEVKSTFHEETKDPWGLLRSNFFLKDFITFFCSEENGVSEVISSLQFFEQIVRIFSFKGHWSFVAAESHCFKEKRLQYIFEKLVDALDKEGVPYQLERYKGKSSSIIRLEKRLVDSLGREWVGPSIKIKPISLKREGEGSHKLLMLAASAFGSLERLIGLMIEQTEGWLPFWIAPEQVRVVIAHEDSQLYVNAIMQKLQKEGIRVQIDASHERLGARIQRAENERIPYLVVIGEREKKQKNVTLYSLGKKGKRIEQTIDIEVFFNQMQQENHSPLKYY